MSTVITDNLTGKTAAGNVTITSEGGAATQSLQQGLAKVWVNLDGTGTIAARDSLNVTGLVDDGVGEYTLNFSNNMGNANYSVTGSAKNNVNALIASTNTFSSSSAEISSNTTSAFGDNSQLCASIDGDLA